VNIGFYFLHNNNSKFSIIQCKIGNKKFLKASMSNTTIGNQFAINFLYMQ
jgi:hypothetical protein